MTTVTVQHIRRAHVALNDVDFAAFENLQALAPNIAQHLPDVIRLVGGDPKAFDLDALRALLEALSTSHYAQTTKNKPLSREQFDRLIDDYIARGRKIIALKDRLQRAAPQWISVEESLPSAYVGVLVRTTQGRHFEGYVDSLGLWWIVNPDQVAEKFPSGYITHWMNTPALPQEKEV